MSFITYYPKLWYRLLFKPESAVEELKTKKPQLKDGLVSIAYLGFLLGLITSLFFSVFSLIAALSNLVAGLITVLISGAFFLVGMPLSLIVVLLLTTVLLKIASIVFKGQGSFGEECGALGLLGSCYVILYVVMYGVMAVLIFGVGLITGAPSDTGSYGLGFMLMMIIMGLIFIPFMPLATMLMATTFTLIAEVEKVNIYRSGLILGLMYGLGTFVFMVFYGIFLFLVMQAIHGMYGMT